MVERGDGNAAPELQPTSASRKDENQQLSEQAELSKWKAAELFKVPIVFLVHRSNDGASLDHHQQPAADSGGYVDQR